MGRQGGQTQAVLVSISRCGNGPSLCSSCSGTPYPHTWLLYGWGPGIHPREGGIGRWEDSLSWVSPGKFPVLDCVGYTFSLNTGQSLTCPWWGRAGVCGEGAAPRRGSCVCPEIFVAQKHLLRLLLPSPPRLDEVLLGRPPSMGWCCAVTSRQTGFPSLDTPGGTAVRLSHSSKSPSLTWSSSTQTRLMMPSCPLRLESCLLQEALPDPAPILGSPGPSLF